MKISYKILINVELLGIVIWSILSTINATTEWRLFLATNIVNPLFVNTWNTIT
jgi:hypothetical protein